MALFEKSNFWNIRKYEIMTPIARIFYKTILVLSFCLFGFATSSFALIGESKTGLEVKEETINAGKKLFIAKCKACHNLDRKLIGPALNGVQDKYKMDWLFSWIRNSQKLIDSGDPLAVKAGEFSSTAMTSFNDLSDEELSSIVMYIENGPIKKVNAQGETTEETVGFGDFGLYTLIIGLTLLMLHWIVIGVAFEHKGPLPKRNNLNAKVMLWFFVIGIFFFIWEIFAHGKYILISHPATKEGAMIDIMMIATLFITGVVFFVMQTLLFLFSYKYRKQKGTKALFYPVNDKLEVIWTIIPAIGLTVLVLGGFKIWNEITATPEKTPQKIEVFGYQFGWKARYEGKDGALGNSNYNLIGSENELGLAIKSEAEKVIQELEVGIDKAHENIVKIPQTLERLKVEYHGEIGEERERMVKKIEFIESGEEKKEFLASIRRKETQINRILRSMQPDVSENVYTGEAEDDIIVDEIHIVIDKPIVFKFRARDVIHSALMSHFRLQMNVVPGVPTQIGFTPTITTKEMREIRKDDEFNYYIVCNKICGNAHYNMRIPIIVETQAEYYQWLKKQKPFSQKLEIETEQVTN